MLRLVVKPKTDNFPETQQKIKANYKFLYVEIEHGSWIVQNRDF